MATPRPGVWGIDLGQCALKAVRLEMVDGKISATAFDYIEHPKILSQPDADPDQLTREALQQFLSRNQLKGDAIVISVPGQSGLARFVKLPPVEEKKIADIVRFEAKQQIPFPLEEVVWDFQKLSSGVVSDGFALETEIGLFAMKRDMISRYLGHFTDVNVEVQTIQMAPLALCNFVTYDLLGKEPSANGEAKAEEEAPAKNKCIVVLDIGTDNSNLVITDGDKVIWQRPIPLGGNHFTRALTKDLKLTFAKGEHLKRNAVKSPDLKAILSALKPVLNDFVGEVQRSLGYFTNTHRDAQIQYLMGLGNAFRLPGLQKYLQEKLQLEVRKLHKLERVTGDEVTNAPTFSENILSFGVAYGLALQGLKLARLQTNLLPQEIRLERLIRAKKPWAAAAAAALLLPIAAYAYGLHLQHDNVFDSRTEAAVKKLNAVKDDASRYMRDYGTQEERIKKAKNEITQITGGVMERDDWALVYRYITLALPRADGSNLGKFQGEYFNKQAEKAYHDLLDKPLAKPTSIEDSEKKEESIKNHLVQINIESVVPLFADDLSAYFVAIHQESGRELWGMDPDDKKAITTYAEAVRKGDKDKLGPLPKNGWVWEIRGYTYNHFGGKFVRNTFLDNLRPENAKRNMLRELPAAQEKKVRETVADRVGYLFLHKGENTEDMEKNPKPNQFRVINKSYLKTLLLGGKEGMAGIPGGFGGFGGGGGVKEGADNAGLMAWNGLGIAGEKAGRAEGLKAGPPPPPPPPPDVAVDPDKAKRTEFVILFVWRTTPASQAKTDIDPRTKK